MVADGPVQQSLGASWRNAEALLPLQERFTEALLRDMAKVPLNLDRIWSTTVSGKPKSDMLVKLQSQHPNRVYHFVEDKLGTLEKV